MTLRLYNVCHSTPVLVYEMDTQHVLQLGVNKLHCHTAACYAEEELIRRIEEEFVVSV